MTWEQEIRQLLKDFCQSKLANKIIKETKIQLPKGTDKEKYNHAWNKVNRALWVD